MINYYLDPLKNCITLSGRATRKQYWLFLLFNYLIFAGISFLSVFVFEMLLKMGWLFSVLISLLYLILTAVATITIGVRRLHDSGRSGLWILINLVPYIGGVVFLILTVLPSEPKDNRYGEYPHKADH